MSQLNWKRFGIFCGSYYTKCLCTLLVLCGVISLFHLVDILSLPPRCPTATGFSFKVNRTSKESFLIDYVNRLGEGRDGDIDRFTEKNESSLPIGFHTKLQQRIASFQSHLQKEQIAKPVAESTTRINLVVVACEDRGRENVKILLKSALIFSQGAHLHVDIFSDTKTIPNLSLDLLQLKWTASASGWHFTFSLHPEWFPSGDIPWRKMWAPCSTQRLFLPSLLPELDSAIYFDTDVIIISNLTEIWQKIDQELTGERLVGMALNIERADVLKCDPDSKIPTYGTVGLQAGVVLMNLTKMRQFGIVDRAIGAYKLYHDRLQLADQDIYNVIFATYKDKLFQLDCTLDFTHVHCGNGPKQMCVDRSITGPYCFCNSTLTEGVKIVHGNGGTFQHDWPFLRQLYQAFKNLDLLTQDPLKIIKDLMTDFDNLQDTPACFSLTSQALYGNAKHYLESFWVLP